MNVLKMLGLFLHSEMTARQDVSSFVRFLSYVYVNVWIPIRLNYLRLKIALRPAFRVGLEALSLMNMVWSMVPISILMVISEIINGISKEWLRLVCLGYEKAIGVTPGSIYEKSMTFSAIIDVDLDNANGEDHPSFVAEGTSQSTESDQTDQSAETSIESSVDTFIEPSVGSNLDNQTEESTNVTIKPEHEDYRECEPESEHKNID